MAVRQKGLLVNKVQRWRRRAPYKVAQSSNPRGANSQTLKLAQTPASASATEVPSPPSALLHRHSSTEPSAASNGGMEAVGFSHTRLPHLVPSAGWVGGGTPPDHLRRAPHALARRASSGAALTPMVVGGGCGGWRGISLRRPPLSSRADPKQGFQEQDLTPAKGYDRVVTGTTSVMFQMGQVVSSQTYSMDANISLLRLYQFEPERLSVQIVAPILVKALMAMPTPDFILCLFLIPEHVICINEDAIDWGLKCLRFEIRDISPPVGVKKAMEMQAEAERRKGAQILESEGPMLDQFNRTKGEAETILARSQATPEGIRTVSKSMNAEGSSEISINDTATDLGLKCLRHETRDISPPVGVKKAMEMQAEAKKRKRAQILESEGAMLDQFSRTKGEAEAILARSQATPEGIRTVSESMSAEEDMNLRVSQEYIQAFAALAKNTTTMIFPSEAGNLYISYDSPVSEHIRAYLQVQRPERWGKPGRRS